MRIIRHVIALTDYQEIDLPAAGELLSVALSRTLPNNAIDLWSLDHEQGGARPVALYVVGTGNPMPTHLGCRGGEEWAWRRFIGTVVTPSGLVWHVFEGPIR